MSISNPFSPRNLRGGIRLFAALTLCGLFFTPMLLTYLSLAPGSDLYTVWMTFIQVVPFGDWLATVTTSLWAEAESGMGSLLGWLTSSQLSFPIHLTVELGKLVFSSVLMIVVTNFIGKKILVSSGGGLMNYAADVIFQILCCLAASLLADVVFRYFEAQLAQANSVAAQVFAAVFSLLTGGGSLWILIVLQVVFINAILAILINCFKLLICYCTFMWMLLNELQGGPDWILFAGAGVCLLILWLLQRAEDALLP